MVHFTNTNLLKLFAFVFLLGILPTNLINANTYSEEALLTQIELAKDDSLVVSSYFRLADLVLYDKPDAAIEYSQKGLTYLPHTNAEYLSGDFWLLEALAYKVKGDMAKTMQLVDKATTQFRQKGATDRLIKCSIFESQILADQGDFTSAEKILQENLRLTFVNDLPKSSIAIYSELGKLYCLEGLYDKGLSNCLKGQLVIDENPTYKAEGQSLYFDIANIYAILQNKDKALFYYELELDLLKKHNLPEDLSLVYLNMGHVELERGKLDKAESHYQKALTEAEEAASDEYICYANLSLGVFFLETDQLKQSKPHLTKALKISEQLGMKAEKRDILLALGNLAIAEENQVLAIKHLKAAEAIDMGGELEVNRRTFLQQIANAYNALGMPEKAFNYEAKLREIKNVNSLKENKQLALGLQTKYDGMFIQRKMQREIDELKEDQAFGYKKQLFLAAIILALGVLCGMFWLGYRVVANENIKLRRANKKAEESAGAKMDFISTISHEIRTPMNGVIGMANLLMEGNPRPDQIKNIEVLKLSADNLLEIINGVLDFSKIEANKVQLEVVDFSLDTLVNNAYDSFQYTANDQPDVDLVLKYEENGLNHLLKGDRLRLNQVLTNLMNNAFKFTEKGNVTLNVKVVEYTSEHAKVAFAVEDTGIGIPKNKQEQIFEDFMQASASTTREYGGTGLGLGITKRFVHLFGSELKLKSEEGKGSTFSFVIDFPLGAEMVKKIAPKKAPKFLPKVEGLRVLMAEDNKINQFVAQKMINNWDMNLDIANDGAEAVQMVKDNEYDIILMDIHMPNMNGFEASAAIRKMSGTKSKIPIIAITASTYAVVEKQARANKINGHLCKPFLSHELYEAITTMIAPKEEQTPEANFATDV